MQHTIGNSVSARQQPCPVAGSRIRRDGSSDADRASLPLYRLRTAEISHGAEASAFRRRGCHKRPRDRNALPDAGLDRVSDLRIVESRSRQSRHRGRHGLGALPQEAPPRDRARGAGSPRIPGIGPAGPRQQTAGGPAVADRALHCLAAGEGRHDRRTGRRDHGLAKRAASRFRRPSPALSRAPQPPAALARPRGYRDDRHLRRCNGARGTHDRCPDVVPHQFEALPTRRSDLPCRFFFSLSTQSQPLREIILRFSILP